MQPTIPDWITDLANQERERRKTIQMMRGPANEFQKSLYVQVTIDLNAYFKEFPNERDNIQQSVESGLAVITRLRSESAEYGYLCQVRSGIVLRNLVVQCMFSHRPSLDRTFTLVLRDDGAIGLSDMSISELSQYLLAPVLFDQLISSGSPDSPQTD